jgi:hypothetical protein
MVGAIDRVHDAEAPHAVLPESLKFSHERLTEGGITTEGLKGTFDGTLQIWRKMANDVRNVGRNVEPIGGH